jgi:hypothetical protein
MSLYNFFGNILPDFGFPDKRIWAELSYMYPAENWDRGQVYDLYKWYQTGIENGQPAFNYDRGNTQIFEWIRNNSPYTSTKVTHWKNVFITGVKDNWIEGKYIGTKLAPANESREISEGIASVPQVLDIGLGKVTTVLVAGSVLLVAYYGLPLITSALKTKKRAFA